MKRFFPTLLALMLSFATLGSARAIPLFSLFDGGSLTVGDKLFDQWSLVFSERSDGQPVNTNNIDVTTLGPVGLDPLDPGPGLRFAVLNNELTVTGDGIFAFIDLQFGFRVSALDPSLKIKDSSLVSSGGSLNRALDEFNDLGIFILESIGTAPGLGDLGTKNVESSVLDNMLTDNTSDSTTFAPQSSIWVTKNILVWSQDTTDTASLTAFEQRFSQTRAVPEPGTLALLGLAVLAGHLTRRRVQ